MKYRITYILGKLDTSVCPPSILMEIFPAFNGEPVELSEYECIVTFEAEQTPVYISSLIKVEAI